MVSILTGDWPYSAAMTDAPSNWLGCASKDQVFTFLPAKAIQKKLATLAKQGYGFDPKPYMGGTLLTCVRSPLDAAMPWRKK